MQLEPGTTLGPYEILAPLGAGGMGEVFRARDSRLARDVAIKAIPAEFAQDAERLARFEREAKLLASLSHPNIAGIFGIEEAAGARYLVLEFVDGETLADRLERGPLSIDDAVEVAKQIATGVEAAHESGVVHRDLKPGNVMLTPSGAVKVLDFGLARSGATEGSGSDVNLSASPTLTHVATQDGVILGTAAYMSPEQARGRAVDRRTDIWSFGCVLYECITGRRVFEGETVSDLVARILEREPDWSALPAATPVCLRTLLKRCLQKDARERLRDIGEARIALGDVSKGETAADVEAGGARRKPGRSAVLPIGLVIVTALISVITTRLVMKPPRPAPLALSVMLPRGSGLDPGVENNLLALAPDGQSLVYAARDDGASRLFLRHLDRPETVEITGTESAHSPFFSPDGRWIGFFAARHLHKVSVRGGAPVEVAEAGADRAGAWLDDGSIVYSPTFASPLYRIDANGGEPQVVTTLDSTRSERSHRWPCALPGGEWVVFTVGVLNSPGGYEDSNIDAVSLRSGERRTLAQGSCARYAPGGWLIIARGGALYAMRVDPDDPRGGAPAVPVLDGVLGVRTSGVAFFDIARNGTLALVPGREERTDSYLAWVDRSGNQTLVPGGPRNYLGFDISPDGTSALAEIGPGGGNSDIFLIDLESGSANQITFTNGNGSARWLPDGEHFVWSRALGKGGQAVVIRSVLGGDSIRVLARSDLPLIVSSVSPDGTTVLFNQYGSVGSDVMEAPIAGGPTRPLVQEPRNQLQGCLSPDGRWVAYASNQTGTSEVCVRPVGRAGVRTLIASSVRGKPLWSPDGRELYYATTNSLMATRLTVRGDAMFAGETRRLFDLPFLGTDSSISDYDVHPSGEKFLVRMPADEINEMREIAVRLGWAASLQSTASEDGQ